MSTRARGWGLRLFCLAALGLAAPAAANAQGRIATINGERLYYEVTGEGAPIVLIHGWSLNLEMWDPQVSALSRHFRVIRYDRRGFGRSSGSEDATWDAADLEALLDHLGESKVHVLGMSQAGRVALQFARRNSDRVSSLILHGATPPGGFGLPWSGADRNPFDAWARIAREEGLDAFRRAWAAHPLMEVPAGRPDEFKKGANVKQLQAEQWFGCCRKHGDPVFAAFAVANDDLARIDVYVLDAQGEAFLLAEARTIEEVPHQTVFPRQAFENRLDFATTQDHRKTLRRASPGKRDVFKRQAEDVFVEEEQGGEGLILGTGRDASIRCQIGEKLFDGVVAEIARVRHSVKANVPFDPSDISLLRSETVMAKPAFLPDLVEQSRLSHCTTIA